MWMQSEGKQTKAFKFGHNSALYRSLIGCFRCAIFHTLLEHSILLNPTGPIRENPDSENKNKIIESRAMGTGTVSPGRPTNPRRPLADSGTRRRLNTSDEQLFDNSSRAKQYINRYTATYESLTGKNKKSSGAFGDQKSITRPSELHQYYVKDDYFRKWIKNESGAVLNLALSLAGGAREPARISNPLKSIEHINRVPYIMSHLIVYQHGIHFGFHPGRR